MEAENTENTENLKKTKQKPKPIPTLYERKEDCCGCTACYAICPREAISMLPDEEGFDYPHIDKEKCIRCGSCIRVCPIKEARAEQAAKKEKDKKDKKVKSVPASHHLESK